MEARLSRVVSYMLEYVLEERYVMPLPMRGRGPVPTVLSTRAEGGVTGDVVIERATWVFTLGLGRAKLRTGVEGVGSCPGGRGKSEIVSSLITLLRSVILLVVVVEIERERMGAMTAADTERGGTILDAPGRGRADVPGPGTRDGFDRVRVRVCGRGPPALGIPVTGGRESDIDVERETPACFPAIWGRRRGRGTVVRPWDVCELATD